MRTARCRIVLMCSHSSASAILALTYIGSLDTSPSNSSMLGTNTGMYGRPSGMRSTNPLGYPRTQDAALCPPSR
jgi:hypothetical protein